MESEVDTNLIAAFETVAGPRKAEDTLLPDLEVVARLIHAAPVDSTGPALLFRGRDGVVRRVPVGEELICGRAADCQLRFAELREISRHHFTVVKQRHMFWLLDHGSFNGTKIRGRRIQKHELRDGDLIDAGGVLFAFVRE